MMQALPLKDGSRRMVSLMLPIMAVCLSQLLNLSALTNLLTLKTRYLLPSLHAGHRRRCSRVRSESRGVGLLARFAICGWSLAPSGQPLTSVSRLAALYLRPAGGLGTSLSLKAGRLLGWPSPTLCLLSGMLAGPVARARAQSGFYLFDFCLLFFTPVVSLPSCGLNSQNATVACLVLMQSKPCSKSPGNIDTGAPRTSPALVWVKPQQHCCG